MVVVVVVGESNSYSNQIAGHTSNSKRPGGVMRTTEDIVDCYSFVEIN